MKKNSKSSWSNMFKSRSKIKRNRRSSRETRMLSLMKAFSKKWPSLRLLTNRCKTSLKKIRPSSKKNYKLLPKAPPSKPRRENLRKRREQSQSRSQLVTKILRQESLRPFSAGRIKMSRE